MRAHLWVLVTVAALALVACGEVATFTDAAGGDDTAQDGGGDPKDAAPDAAFDCDAQSCGGTASDGCCPASCNAASDADCTAMCGNEVIEPGESCDPLTSCPTSCPAVGCQLRQLDGAGTCTAACADAGLQTTCSAISDGCCPDSCNATNDLDCAAVCGNNVVEPGETCDPLGSCPTSCPQQACQLYTLASGGSCQAQCVAGGQQTQCVSGDGCCPGNGLGACNQTNDSDCAPVCGNGTVEQGETCDGNCACGAEPYTCFTSTGSAANCTLQCHVPVQTCGATDACCPYVAATDGADCDRGNDAQCTGVGWSQVDWHRPADYRTATCDVMQVYGIRVNGSYLFTTCARPGENPGTGDSVIQSIVDNTGRNYNIANDDCTDAAAIPLMAGWSCQNNTSAVRMSCASPNAGGFIVTDPQVYRLDVTVCPFNGTAFGTAPFHVWYQHSGGTPNPG